MTNEISAKESQPIDLPLSADEATLLEALGRELASSKTWWGGSRETDSRSVIAVQRLSQGVARVTFRDVVGVVRVGKRQIEVLPKIPAAHFLYLAARSSIAPRLSAATTSVSSGVGLLEILSRWLLDAAEELLRGGLRKDYQSYTDDLPEVRGRVLAIETGMLILQGKPSAVCDFEELTEDAPLNRIVRSACQRVSLLPAVSELTRRRARQIVYRLPGIGEAQASDMRVPVDRLARAYVRAIPLARLLLSGCGISSAIGRHAGTAFLIRTPEIVEDGLRATLAGLLEGEELKKRKLMLGDSGLSVNPDLVFCRSSAVGDVKYRYLSSDWSRSDLNQVVTFATAFGYRRGALVGFVRDASSSLPRHVPIGSVSVRAFGWTASPSMDPAESARLLAGQIRQWLGGAQ